VEEREKCERLEREMTTSRRTCCESCTLDRTGASRVDQCPCNGHKRVYRVLPGLAGRANFIVSSFCPCNGVEVPLASAGVSAPVGVEDEVAKAGPSSASIQEASMSAGESVSSCQSVGV
jgi:hypothetical protein